VTKATGRGRNWARKGWANLAPSTQRKYERVGIDATRYGQGYSLNLINKFAADQERFYGRDADEVKEELRQYDPTKVIDGIVRQREMQRLYNEGRQPEAHDLWEGRDQELPEWMNSYHAYFS
jgi:hypothetical protein